MPDTKTPASDTPMPNAGQALPRYKCHKIVGAAKVRAWEGIPDSTLVRLFTDYGSFDVASAKVGPGDGYVVQYEDGYVSFSPAKAFEDGYTREDPHLIAEKLTQEQLGQFFTFAHLPSHLQAASRPFAELAAQIIAGVPRNPERTVALRKLLEAKDCAVRAVLAH